MAAKQDVMYRDILFMKREVSSRTNDDVGPSVTPPSERQNTQRKIMQASVMKTWLGVPGVMIQYVRSAGRRKRHSILVGLRTPRSRVLFARFSGLWHSSIPILNIRIQNVVPEDSPIFIACKSGNVLRAQQLLETGQAGLNDITPRNETILTVGNLTRGYLSRTYMI